MKFWTGCLLLAAVSLPALAQPDPTDFHPGLQQTIRPADPDSVQTDARVSRLIAIYVAQDEPVSPFLDPGAFVSVWTGFLNLRINDYFVLSAQGRGGVRVEIDGRVVLHLDGPELSGKQSEEIDMKKGPNRIRVTYRSPLEGDAWFRLYWRNPLQALEPIPPEAFTHDPSDSELKKGGQRRLGRWLFATGRCIRCHATSGDTAMPELLMDAPAFTGIGDRLDEPWMASWLLDEGVADRQMPRMLRGSRAAMERDAYDIAAFLAAQSTENQSDPLQRLEKDPTITHGGDLFNFLGCITCHRFPGDTPLEHETRTSLHHVKAKWKPDALVEFLLDPSVRYEWIRMPHFRLSTEEAEALGAYLMSRCRTDIGTTHTEGNADRGRQRLNELGCVGCHTLEGTTVQLRTIPLSQLNRADVSTGCWSGKPGAYPGYEFTDEERAALVAFVRNDLSALQRRVFSEFANRQIAALRCIACHTRDTQSDLWSHLIVVGDVPVDAADVIDEFGDLDENELGESNIHLARPPLTWAGEKLHSDWTETFLAGTLPYKPRPQLKARMPGFPVYAHGLAVGLSRDHGFPTSKDPLPPVNLQMAGIGRQLIRVDRMGCVSCHAVGSQGALSGPAAEAINFQYVPARLRKHYFDRFVLDPHRLLPGTMMPKFVDEEGQSPLRDVLDGDARAQFEVIWEFMRTLP